MLLGLNEIGVSAAAEGPQRWAEATLRMQQVQFQVKEGRWAEEIPQTWRQPKGGDRTEMKKEEKLLRCAQWNSVDHREEMHEKIQR